MKSIAIVATASVFVFATTTMVAAGAIHERQKHQRARIRQGTRSGEITPGEAARLAGQQRAVQADREKALADGKITKRERRSLRHEQNHASKSIRHEKHDAQYTP